MVDVPQPDYGWGPEGDNWDCLKPENRRDERNYAGNAIPTLPGLRSSAPCQKIVALFTSLPTSDEVQIFLAIYLAFGQPLSYQLPILIWNQPKVVRDFSVIHEHRGTTTFWSNLAEVNTMTAIF